VLVSDIVMTNASDGARIKVWPGMAPTSTDLTSGGGSGHVKNVTYQNVHIENVDYAIEITQCYGATNLTVCSRYPSSLVIEDIVFSVETTRSRALLAADSSQVMVASVASITACS
jgi:galacturan 1,4-alpha-galacturonidase